MSVAFTQGRLHTAANGKVVCSKSLQRVRPQFSYSKQSTVCNTAVVDAPVSPEVDAAAVPKLKLNQYIREGHYESSLVQLQASKRDSEQPSITTRLQPLDLSQTADIAVVGCGPAGLFLAAELAKRGLNVALLGNDVPFVNNYGVWTDEFKALGLEHTLECSWPDAVCYFGEGKEVKVGRGYGRVGRRKLREHLLQLCEKAGVRFMATQVEDIVISQDGMTCQLTISNGAKLNSRLVTLAAGAAAGKFLQYESGAPLVAAQTAYGIEAEVEGYEGAYPPGLMTFMDFRRHHSGVWEGTAQRLKAGAYPNAGDGLWGTADEVPSFLYAMPLGGKRVFLEETCLVAKPALPFATLKRRLDRRLAAMGIKVTEVHEEEWSYIPVGGPLPLPNQPITAFGAAANLIHPATGFSVSRSFREAPLLADEVVSALSKNLPVADTANKVWATLWPQEKRTQSSFHVFGMELLANLDLKATNDFFNTFFNLPPFYWRGFLASTLTSSDLIAFALITFVKAPWDIKFRLIAHLATDPAGQYLINAYTAKFSEEGSKTAESPDTPAIDASVASSQ